MTMPPTARVFALAARDLAVAVAASETFSTYLDAFAKRRAASYAPDDTVPTDETYWPALATALAPIAAPEAMPMSGLIAAGVTLEGGARGVRGWFTSAPSERDRKRVSRVAALAGRVMSLVAGPENALTDDIRRGIAMTQASFGLGADELARVRAPESAAAAPLEIYGELDARIRRELLRGAWQICLRGTPSATDEETVRTIATKLELADQCAPLRAEVEAHIARIGDTAAMAVELSRSAIQTVADDKLASAIEHLIRAMAPPARMPSLRARAASQEPIRFDPAMRALDRGRRVQAIALAWTTMVGTDPAYSAALRLRAALTDSVGEAGAAYELNEAVDTIDRYLQHRVNEVAPPAGDLPPPVGDLAQP